MPDGPAIDPKEILPQLLDFIRKRTAASGRHRLVIGLSGGLDSTTSAYLGVRALGRENLVGYIMPYATSSAESTKDAVLVAGELGIEHGTVDITPMVDAYFKSFPDANKERRGNFMARMRMAILYDRSEVQDALVLGTGNHTEALLGYTTMWGDMACAFTPLGSLFKTQVRQLAEHLGVPQKIIDKPPSADLWAGQTDEGEMGLTYEEVDKLLYQMFDLEYDNRALKKAGFDPTFIRKIRSIVAANAFKRQMPDCPKT